MSRLNDKVNRRYYWIMRKLGGSAYRLPDPPSLPGPKCRLQIDETTFAVSLDGSTQVTDENQARFLLELKKAYPHRLSSKQIKEHCPALKDYDRFGRLCKKLPPQLRLLVLAGKGHGYGLSERAWHTDAPERP